MMEKFFQKKIARKCLGAAALLFIVLVSGCATVPKGDTVVRQEQLKDLCERYHIQWQWDSISQVVTLSGYEVKASALIGSHIVVMGEETISLSSPLERVKNNLIVPPDFEEKVVKRLQLTIPPAIKRINTLVLDAGHGGKDPGAIGKGGLQEKIVVLDIVQRLKKILEDSGVKVILTRDKDEFLTLEQRTEIASRAKADMFISIHANASRSRKVQGIEVFSCRDLGGQQNSEQQIKKNQDILAGQLSMRADNQDLKNIIFDMLYFCCQAESRPLAERVAFYTAAEVDMKNRGSKEAGFFVLRNNLMPAILVEVGFLSNPEEEKLLEDDSYRQRLAEGIMRGISAHVQYQ
ncbi:MAG: N-acetylmuramoyl-L-alanine amidase [Candidatus Omnitrophota bacterium]